MHYPTCFYFLMYCTLSNYICDIYYINNLLKNIVINFFKKTINITYTIEFLLYFIYDMFQEARRKINQLTLLLL